MWSKVSVEPQLGRKSCGWVAGVLVMVFGGLRGQQVETGASVSSDVVGIDALFTSKSEGRCLAFKHQCVGTVCSETVVIVVRCNRLPCLMSVADAARFSHGGRRRLLVEEDISEG
ncbi:hypothetical protein LZ30DRAFT_377292 [Colletotrichum cereale]|nr:hypothetical protein LZ30DRAFT_377292 [Colletotrichum cereale]